VNDERSAAVVPDHFVGLLMTLAARRDAIVVTYRPAITAAPGHP